MRKITAMLLAAPMALLSFTVPAQASEWTAWTRMTPDSYKFDFATMGNRCLSGAAITTVTEAECREAKQMVEAGECPYVPIPNGTRYEFMNGLKAGSPHVYLNMEKQLPGVKMAYSCKLRSTGRVFDWYVGQNKKSCGNLGARESTPPLLTYAPPPPAPTPIGPPKITTTMTPTQESGLTAPYLFGTPDVTYRGGKRSINAGSKSGAAATSTSTSNSGQDGCNTCKPPHAGH